MGGQLSIVSSQPLPPLTVKSSSALPGAPKISSGQAMAANIATGGLAMPITTLLRGEEGTKQDVAKFLSGAGLPTSIDQIPAWLDGLKNLNIQHLFVDPVKKAIDNPTTENVVATVPFFGPLANSMSKDIQSGDIGGAALRLAGNLAAVKGAGQVAPGASAIKSQVLDARDIISQVAKATQGHSLTAAALDKILPENLTPDFKGGAYSDFFGESGKAVPIRQSPNFDPAAYKAGVAARTTQPPAPPSPIPAAATSSAIGKLSIPIGSEAESLFEKNFGKEFKEAGDLAEWETGSRTGNASTLMASGWKAPASNVIQSPLSPAPAINKTLVSYDRNLLVHMARGGDLNALRELIRNPGGIDVASAVPNSKFLLEPGTTRVYGGPQ